MSSIIADDREPSNIIELIKQQGIPVEIKHLETGDYIVGDIIVERKEIKDLFNSVRPSGPKDTGRLWNQLYKMKNSGCRGILIVVGSIPLFDYSTKEKISKEKYLYYLNLLSSVEIITMLSYGIGFKVVTSNNEFARKLLQIWNYCNRKPSKSPVMLKKEDSVSNIKSNMLSCVPGIGRSASEILSKIPFSSLVKMTEEELSNIVVNNRKLGSRVRKLYEVLNS